MEQRVDAGAGERAALRRYRVLAMVLGLAVVLALCMGFVHVVYGGQVGFTVVVKDEWGFHDTFVDWGEIEEMSLFEVAGSGHAGVVRAMVRAGHLPELEERLREMQRAADEARQAVDELEHGL